MPYSAYLDFKSEVYSMIGRSYMNVSAKKGYTIHYNSRYNVLSKK